LDEEGFAFDFDFDFVAFFEGEGAIFCYLGWDVEVEFVVEFLPVFVGWLTNLPMPCFILATLFGFTRCSFT
jgi:hypothetical protein